MKIYIAGHNGMVGSAINRALKKNKNVRIITKEKSELNLLDQKNVKNFLKDEKPDTIIIAAARVGGILANSTYPAEFLYENLQIQNNIIHGAHLSDIQRILFLGSSCIYPKGIDRAINEEDLLTGELEDTNEAYSIAKIAGIKMCASYNSQYGRDYRALMPTNLYGPCDNFNEDRGHVIPALIKRFHEAKTENFKRTVVWGTGKPLREFLYVDDLADACNFVLNLNRDTFLKITHSSTPFLNVGTGKDISILELVKIIKDVIGYSGELVFDSTKPDGTKRKLLNSGRLASLGWAASTNIIEGLKSTYEWFKVNNAS